MIKRVVPILFLAIASTASAQVYTWTDSSGIVHYSDQPHEGAEKVKLPEAQSYVPPSPDDKKEPNDYQLKENEGNVYTAINVISPQPNETIRNNDGSISISADIEPPLFIGDKAQLLFDGTLVGKPQLNGAFSITGVDRGTHSIVVQIINASGEVVMSSPTIAVYMQRPRVGMGK